MSDTQSAQKYPRIIAVFENVYGARFFEILLSDGRRARTSLRPFNLTNPPAFQLLPSNARMLKGIQRRRWSPDAYIEQAKETDRVIEFILDAQRKGYANGTHGQAKEERPLRGDPHPPHGEGGNPPRKPLDWPAPVRLKDPAHSQPSGTLGGGADEGAK